MSADPRKIGALVVDSLGPPDRLPKKAKPPMGDEGDSGEDPGEEDSEDASAKAGELAMEDFKKALDAGDAGAMFDAIKTAVENC